MSEQFQRTDCGENDVVAFGDDIFKAGKFKKALYQSFEHGDLRNNLTNRLENQNIRIDRKILSPENNPKEPPKWFSEGVDCEILKSDDAKGWRKGKVKVKVTVEFWHEEPENSQQESSLDDIRNSAK